MEGATANFEVGHALYAELARSGRLLSNGCCGCRREGCCNECGIDDRIQ